MKPFPFVSGSVPSSQLHRVASRCRALRLEELESRDLLSAVSVSFGGEVAQYSASLSENESISLENVPTAPMANDPVGWADGTTYHAVTATELRDALQSSDYNAVVLESASYSFGASDTVVVVGTKTLSGDLGDSSFATITSDARTTSLFQIGSGVSLTLSDLTMSGITVTRAKKDTNAPISVASGGTLTISSGTYTENQSNPGGTKVVQGGLIYSAGSVTIEGGTFTKNSAGSEKGSGGVVYNDGGTLVISGGMFGALNAGNTAGTGGVIYGDAQISNAEFKNNSATVSGGVIYSRGSLSTSGIVLFQGNSSVQNGGAIVANATVNFSGQTTFEDNSASNGGAIYIGTSNSLSTTGTTIFKENTASSYGGAIYGGSSVSTSFSESTTFEGNTADLDGGAIYTQGTISLSDTVLFTKNSAEHNAGAIFLSGGDSSLTTNADAQATFEYNYCGAGYNGGAIDSESTLLTLTSVLFQYNSTKGSTPDWTTSAGGSGGALMNWGTAVLTDCQFVGNSADNGGAIANGYSSASLPGIMTILASVEEDQPAFSGNQAFYGGAVINAGDLQIGMDRIGQVCDYSVIFSENTALKNGGAISNTNNLQSGEGKTLQLYKTRFVDNTASNGGAIISQTTVTTARDTLFRGNSATGETGSGGAIDLLIEGTLTTQDTLFVGNKASKGLGGALQVWGTATLDQGTVIGDTENEVQNSALLGGGLSIIGPGSAKLTNASLVNNEASYGGGVYSCGALELVTGVTISGNTASENGGGVSLATRSLTIAKETKTYYGSLRVSGIVGSKNTISGNSAKNGAGYGGGIVSMNGTFIDVVNAGTLKIADNSGKTSAANVALANTALLKNAYDAVNVTGSYLYRSPKIVYTVSYQNETTTVDLTGFSYFNPGTVVQWGINGDRVDYTEGGSLKKEINGLVTFFDLSVYDAEGNDLVYHLPTELTSNTVSNELVWDNALEEYDGNEWLAASQYGEMNR